MDTLESRVCYNYKNLRVERSTPILWRNKTPQEVFREQYSDRYTLIKDPPVQRSTRTNVDYCESYSVKPHKKEDQNVSREEGGQTFATLIPIPEKR